MLANSSALLRFYVFLQSHSSDRSSHWTSIFLFEVAYLAFRVNNNDFLSFSVFLHILNEKMCSIPRKLEIRLGEIEGLIELFVATRKGVATWLFYMDRAAGVLWSQRLRYHALLVRQGLHGQHY